MYLEVQVHEDRNQLTFLPHVMLLDSGIYTFETKEAAVNMPFAASLFDVEGVKGVTVGTDYICVTKDECVSTDRVRSECSVAIKAYLTPLVKAGNAAGGYEGLLLLDAVVVGGLLFL